MAINQVMVNAVVKGNPVADYFVCCKTENSSGSLIRFAVSASTKGIL